MERSVTIKLFGAQGRIGAQLLGADNVGTGWGATPTEALSRLTTNITAMTDEQHRQFFGPVLIDQAAKQTG